MTASRTSRSSGRLLLALAALLDAGCGRYADFTLPVLPGGPAQVRWEWRAEPLPVLSRAPSGSWDSVDVLNPSVIAYNGLLYNFYSGFDGQTWHTGLAVSADGASWIRKGKVLSPEKNTWEGDDYIAANGSALAARNEILYYYQAGRTLPRIGLARSSDGEHWRKEPDPVLPPGPRGSWDERGVADPYVIQAGGKLYLFYLGQDRARRQRLGVARSGDGVRWEKLRSNPILEPGEPRAFDEDGLGEPAVWTQGGSYWMLYTGRDRKENRRMGLARSSDGVHWHKLAQPVMAGDQDWNRAVLCDPTVMRGSDPNEVLVWFGGGDLPKPDERLDGQIGRAALRMLP